MDNPGSVMQELHAFRHFPQPEQQPQLQAGTDKRQNMHDVSQVNSWSAKTTSAAAALRQLLVQSVRPSAVFSKHCALSCCQRLEDWFAELSPPLQAVRHTPCSIVWCAVCAPAPAGPYHGMTSWQLPFLLVSMNDAVVTQVACITILLRKAHRITHAVTSQHTTPATLAQHASTTLT